MTQRQKRILKWDEKERAFAIQDVFYELHDGMSEHNKVLVSLLDAADPDETDSGGTEYTRIEHVGWRNRHRERDGNYSYTYYDMPELRYDEKYQTWVYRSGANG